MPTGWKTSCGNLALVGPKFYNFNRNLLLSKSLPNMMERLWCRNNRVSPRRSAQWRSPSDQNKYHWIWLWRAIGWIERWRNSFSLFFRWVCLDIFWFPLFNFNMFMDGGSFHDVYFLLQDMEGMWGTAAAQNPVDITKPSALVTMILLGRLKTRKFSTVWSEIWRR